MKQINKAKMQQIEQFTGKQNKQFKVVPNPVHEKLFNEIVDGVVAEIIKESGADKTYEENIRILAETNKDVTKINVATIFNSSLNPTTIKSII